MRLERLSGWGAVVDGEIVEDHDVAAPKRRRELRLDDAYLMACMRYVELNPVRARLVVHPGDWPWSSARPHLKGTSDALAEADRRVAVDDWVTFLDVDHTPGDDDAMRASSRTGRPLGDAAFIASLERALGRTLGRRKPGPKPKPVPLDQPRLLQFVTCPQN